MRYAQIEDRVGEFDYHVKTAEGWVRIAGSQGDDQVDSWLQQHWNSSVPIPVFMKWYRERGGNPDTLRQEVQSGTTLAEIVRRMQQVSPAKVRDHAGPQVEDYSSSQVSMFAR